MRALQAQSSSRMMKAPKIRDTARKLKLEWLGDQRDWEKKDEVAGRSRKKGKVRLHGLVGYLTKLGSTGKRFADPV